MNYSEKIRPKTFDEVLGNNTVKRILQNDVEKKSTILYGNTGCGKSTLAMLYLPQARIYDGTNLSTDSIRCMRGQVIINEIHKMNTAKQQMLGSMIESGYIYLVGTTLENPSGTIHKTLQSRMRILEVTFPSRVEVKRLIESFTAVRGVTIKDEVMEYIIDKFRDVRKIIDFADDLTYLRKEVITLEDVDTEIVASGNNSMESLKSAMQKSIRGSDVDASVLYANELMKCGYLEELCRRLRVIASEDIGLANPNAIVVVDACINSALQIGLPECKFNVLQAVVFLALQPKSNSIHKVIDRLKNVGEFRVPKHIAYVHSYSYKFPHDYPNNYVKQDYLPIELEDNKFYEAGNNKIEKSYEEYWNKIKGCK